jgi:hypothetical protein
MAQANGLRDGVIAREKDRQRTALNLQPMHGPQTLGHGVFLAGPLTLEAGNVVLEITYLGLGAQHPPVEQRHLLALLAQSPVNRLELSQETCLALPRFCGLRAFLLESLLRLLERVLLVTELRAVLLVLPRRRQSRGQHEEGEEEW